MKQQPLLILVIAVVFVGSLLMVFAKQPERVVVVSDDGFLRIEGLVRERNSVFIEMISTSSQQYAVSVDQGRKIENVTITFIPSPALGKSVGLLLFDRTKNQWTRKLFSYDVQREYYFIQLDELSSTLLQIDESKSDQTVDNENLLY